jgi:ferredoxin-NADP reductase
MVIQKISGRLIKTMAVQTQQAKVMSVRQLTSHVRELTILPLEWKLTFKPGQWVSLHLPIGQHPPLLRAYSIAEPESTTGNIVLVFDRVPQGLGSGYLFRLRERDHLLMAGPYGRFAIPEPLTQDLLMIARYTGIVPIHCIIKHLFANKVPTRIMLVYSGPSQQELIYHAEFLDLASRHDTFHYAPIILSGDGSRGEDYRPVMEAVRLLIGGGRNVFPMICGIQSFVRPLRTYFTELGFGKKDIRHETYD